jgi:esterase/lipase
VISTAKTPVYQLDLKAIAQNNSPPTFFIIKTKDQLTAVTETFHVYNNFEAYQKKLLLIKEAQHGMLSAKGGETTIIAFQDSITPSCRAFKNYPIENDLQ